MPSILCIGGFECPAKTIANCKQILKTIDIGTVKRNINGDLIKLRNSRKLWTSIICQDEYIPDLLTYEIGDTAQIGCIQRLWKKVTPEQTCILKRRPYDKSVLGHNKKGDIIYSFEEQGGDQKLLIPKNVEFISYRPWVTIMITKIETTYQDWDMKTEWRLEGEEV